MLAIRKNGKKLNIRLHPPLPSTPHNKKKEAEGYAMATVAPDPPIADRILS